MEKVKEATLELESIDPTEWHNIPRPIVVGIQSLKTCIKFQTGFLDYFHKHFQDFEGRCNVRIINVQKSISECLDKIKDNDENINNLLVTADQKAKDRMESFQQKITESLFEQKKSVQSKLEEIMDLCQLCNKRVDTMPTTPQINTMIASVADKIRDKLKQELKEKIVNPEVYSLNQKIIALNL